MNESLTIKTNNIPREMISFQDLPERSKCDFNYLSEGERYESRLVKYRECFYDVYDSEVNRNDGAFNSKCFPIKWDSYISDSFFSGVLFQLAEDNECVICATYYS